MILTLKNFIKTNEALTLSDAKKYTNAWLEAGLKNHLDEWFKGKDRLYIPLEKEDDLKNEIEDALNVGGYNIISYNQGTCQKKPDETSLNILDILQRTNAPQQLILQFENGLETKVLNVNDDLHKQIENALMRVGHIVTNYESGVCQKRPDKNIVGINKTLLKLGVNKSIIDKYANELELRRNIVDSEETAEYTIVISRHPIDVAGSSTDRPWRSCMALGKGASGEDRFDTGQQVGSNSRFVIEDVKGGTIVAYLIKSFDKNIEEPIGRILMKPYVNKNDVNDILYVSNRVYKDYQDGRDAEAKVSFPIIVDKWLDKRQGEKFGQFKLRAGLYDDGKSSVRKFPKSPENMAKMLQMDAEERAIELKAFKTRVAQSYVRDYLPQAKISVDGAIITKSLKFKSFDLEELPVDFEGLSDIVDLSYNNFENVPIKTEQLAKVQFLNLEHNKIRLLPNNLNLLTRLAMLNLSYNLLTALPESLGDVKTLKQLIITNNAITALPESLDHLSHLTRIYLSYNRLTTIPNDIYKLKELNFLDLSYNRLTTIPEEIKLLPNLVYLNLKGNNLSSEEMTKVLKLVNYKCKVTL